MFVWKRERDHSPCYSLFIINVIFVLYSTAFQDNSVVNKQQDYEPEVRRTMRIYKLVLVLVLKSKDLEQLTNEEE